MLLKLNTIFLLLSIASTPALFSQSDSKNLSDFSTIKVSGNIDVVLIADSKNYADIEVEDTKLEKLEIEHHGSTLKIHLKNKGLFNIFGGSGKAYISLHYNGEINKITSSASANVRTKEILVTQNLIVNSSSGSHCDLEVDVRKLKATSSSGADIEIFGTADFQDLSVSSGGSYEADNVESHEVLAKASSGGHAKIWASEFLKGKASSGGSIDYKGKPDKIEVKTSSGGSISSMR